MHDTILKHIDAILGEQGLAVSSGLTYSENQFKYANQVAEGFVKNDGRSVVNALQAATGTGKTIGYLVPLMVYAALTGERVGVSTYTRLLQSQIVFHDAIAVAGWVKSRTGVELKIARRVGKSAYVSLESCQMILERLSEEEGTFANECDFLSDLIEWCGSTSGNTGVIDDFLRDCEYETLPSSLSMSQITCGIGDQSDAYERDVLASKEADLIVINHALMASSAFGGGERLGTERPLAIMVCDEADRMADVASQINATDLPMYKITQKLEDLSETFECDEIADEAKNLFDLIYEINQVRPAGKRTLLLNTPQTSSFTNDIQGAIGKLLKTLEPALEKAIKADAKSSTELVDTVEDIEVASEIAANLKKIYQKLSGNADRSAVAVTWSPVRELPRLCSSERNAGRIYRNYLVSGNAPDEKDGKKLKAILFTSATLGATGAVRHSSFDEFLAELGIFRTPPEGKELSDFNVRSDLFKSYEPSLFGSMSFVVADPRVNSPKKITSDEEYEIDPEWLEYTANAIRAAHTKANRTLVLTTSFSDAQEIGGLIEDLKPLIHTRGTKLEQLIAEYKSAPGQILISPSAWEGVNLPGMVDELVITKIPYGNPFDPEFEFLKLNMEARGFTEEAVKKIIQSKLVKATLRKLSQGLGRGIRAKSDVCRTWITDVRFPQPMPIAGSIDKIILDAKPRQTNGALLRTIPQRFMANFEAAPLFRLDSKEIYFTQT